MLNTTRTQEFITRIGFVADALAYRPSRSDHDRGACTDMRWPEKPENGVLKSPLDHSLMGD